KAERRLIMDFPNSLGFMEENAQAGALDELLREINLHIEEIEKEHKSKNKMIMSLGVAAGVLISILLL
ncbi:MAG: stage III sporulation protein AB, partial [Lachnospiraceae bacterium]|nr:stage III sporulation protein AB [Lachnospiraceae bacterium]